MIAVDGDGGVNLGSEECSQLAQEQDEHAKPDRKKGAEEHHETKKTHGGGGHPAEPGFFQEQAVSATEIWVSVPLLSGDATEGVRGARYKECARHTGRRLHPKHGTKSGRDREREPQRQQQKRTSLLLCVFEQNFSPSPARTARTPKQRRKGFQSAVGKKGPGPASHNECTPGKYNT